MAITKNQKNQTFAVVIATPGIDSGVIVDRKNVKHGEEVTPKDPNVANMLVASGRAVKASSDEAKDIVKAAKAERKAIESGKSKTEKDAVKSLAKVQADKEQLEADKAALEAEKEELQKQLEEAISKK